MNRKLAKVKIIFSFFKILFKIKQKKNFRFLVS